MIVCGGLCVQLLAWWQSLLKYSYKVKLISFLYLHKIMTSHVGPLLPKMSNHWHTIFSIQMSLNVLLKSIDIIFLTLLNFQLIVFWVEIALETAKWAILEWNIFLLFLDHFLSLYRLFGISQKLKCDLWKQGCGLEKSHKIN